MMQQEVLFPLIRRELQDLLNGYLQDRALLDEADTYMVPLQLGDHAGVLGAILLAGRAIQNHSGPG